MKPIKSIDDLLAYDSQLMLVQDAANPGMAVPLTTAMLGGSGGTFGLTVLSQTSLTVDTTSRALPTIPSGARVATLQLRGCDAYVRLDAQAAVAGNAAARLVLDGSEITLESASELAGFRIVAASGTGTLSVTYFGTAP